MPYANLTSQDAETRSQGIEKDSLGAVVEGGVVVEDLGTYEPNDAVVLPTPNDEPLRARIVNPRSRKLLARLIRSIKERITPPLTAAELALLDEKKAIDLQQKVLSDEAHVAARRVSNALHNLGYSHVRRGYDGEIKQAKLVTFDVIVSTEDAHWLHVDMDKLPYGVNSSSISQNQDIINHLGKAVGHKVNVRANDEMGVWYIIERASGMMGLPIHVKYSDMLEQFTPSSTGLTIPLGMTANRKRVYEDLDDMVHVLVAGETGGGKSNTQNVFITTLAMRNSPDALKFLLMDMKAGMEFQFYEGLPHLLTVPGVTDGIIEDPDKVYPAFNWLLSVEAKRRMALIRSSGHRSINDYNVRRKNPMPRLVVVCDEWGTARLADHGKEAETELAKAVMLLRAVGIHVIIGTQTPTKEVLGLLVRSNLPTKIAHNCNEMSASTIIVGDTSAMGLPVGRGVYKRGGMRIPVQFPFLSEHMVKDIVANIKAGKHEQTTAMKTHDVTIDELLTWGLHHNGGGLPVRDLHKVFDHRGISQAEIKELLKDLDEKEVLVDGKLYFVEPGSGSRPRRLVGKA